MKTLVISSSPLIVKDNSYYAYSPYAKELEIWAKYSTEIHFACPVWIDDKGLLISKINFKINKVVTLKEFNLKNSIGFINTLRYSFFNFFKIYKSIQTAQHLHIRAPGNLALYAIIVQIFFPKKNKTVKYAGNWDLKSKQPISYKIQKFILNSTFLSKNCKVLVYGEWKNSSKNIIPFFTASYKESEKTKSELRKFSTPIKFIFVGTLSAGKRPNYAIELVKKLNEKGIVATLELYGNGIEKEYLKTFVVTNKLEKFIFFKGNQAQAIVKKAYQESHFLLLPSKSEGWPKAVAEAMFWGCLPIATNVSCISYMLDNNNRGIILDLVLQNDIDKILSLLKVQELYLLKANNAMIWSRIYTIEYFESEIKKLIQL